MKSFFQRFKTDLTPACPRLRGLVTSDEFNFLRRKYNLEKDGLWTWIQPGNYIQQMLKAYGEQTSTTTIRQFNSDGREVRDLDRSKKSAYSESIERYHVAFTVKELGSRMSNPTTMSFHHLTKCPGYLKKTMDYCLVVELPQAGEGYVKKGEHYWRSGTC